MATGIRLLGHWAILFTFMLLEFSYKEVENQTQPEGARDPQVTLDQPGP